MKTQRIPTCLIRFLFSLLLPLIILANDEPKQRPTCLPFICGTLGKTGYPFSNATSTECGSLVIDCGETPQIHQRRRNYDVKSIFYNMSIVLHDQLLQRQLSSNSCDLDHNFELPASEPYVSFVSRTPNLTLYKCSAKYRRFSESDSAKFYTYKSCKENIVLHYNYADQLPSSLSETDNRHCSVIQIPLIAQPPSRDVWEENPFSLLTAEFSFEWNVSKDCSNCYSDGDRCITNKRTQQFNCDIPGMTRNVPPPPKSNIERKVKIGIGAGIGGCALTGLVVLLVVYCRRRRKRYLNKSSGLISSRNVSPDFSMMPDQEKGFLAPIFSYKELVEATNNFDDDKELGDGGFGTVYHGELKDGRVVAVKRLYENNGKRVEQFMNEVQILSRLRHKNLVILYGCTSRHSRELLLVYEFVPNGTVADHLHGERAGSGLVPWSVRMNIAIETADALKYLHVSEIIHRDVKTNNILLDENFHVKVADFGLSRLFPTDVTHVSTAPQGTPGYVDPEYYQCYQLTSKSDVYSFGVVLVELISSKPAVDISRHRHEINLSNLAINKIHNHALHELIDPSLGFETDSSVKKMITLVAELAFRCLQQDSDMRPSMTEVLEVLKEIENEGSKKAKGVEIDIAADDIGLLKNNISPFSPDSVTQRWDSDITPNTSS